MCQTNCHEDIADRAVYRYLGGWFFYIFVRGTKNYTISVGYTILNIYEIWQYKITQYDSKTSSGGHFANYINTFLKVKHEISGWPSEVITELMTSFWYNNEESKVKYIAEYAKVEEIKLDSKNICINPGLITVVKLCLSLNSFWGKFGQRENRLKTKNNIITTCNELMELLSSNEVDVTGLLLVNDDVLYISYVCKE